MVQQRPRPTLFPYTPLFRSRRGAVAAVGSRGEQQRARIARERHGGRERELLRAAAAPAAAHRHRRLAAGEDRKSTRLNSSHSQISYAVFCLKKKRTRPPCRA